MLEQFGNISSPDLDLMPITDNPAEVVQIINDFYAHEALKPKLDLG
jgi:hypothetical protein